jgi:alpha-methylacyl-CoA racemase
MAASGPLCGVRVVEFTGLGPAPHCAMLLSDMGADVVRIDRLGSVTEPTDVTNRGRRSLALNLKEPAHIQQVLRVIDKADVVIEGFRPGVMERLGLGPDVLLARNPRLVYGRMTGWGQDGPLAAVAGHDLNYIAITGALDAIGPAGFPPPPPLNLVGDYGGGSLYLALGIVAALLERRDSNLGQVIDAAIVDGTASLMALFTGVAVRNRAHVEKGSALLGGSAPFYRCYECADGRHVAVGPIEPQFYALLLDRIGVDLEELGPQMDRAQWQRGSELLARIFLKRTQDEWCAILEGTDACFAPVLPLTEAPGHAHLKARGTYREEHGIVQPAPAPRFSRTPGAIQGPPSTVNMGGDQALADWGVSR